MVTMRISRPLPPSAKRQRGSFAEKGSALVLLMAVCLSALLASTAGPASALPVPRLDIPSLCSESDMVVEGRVSGVTRQGSTVISLPGAQVRGWSMVAILNVQHVIKGETAGEAVRFRFALPSEESYGYSGVPVGAFGIFFLAGKGHSLTVLNPYHPFVPAAPSQTAEGGGCLEQIVAGMANVFLVRGSSVPDHWTRLRTVMALETIDGPSATAALELAAKDKDLSVRVWAISDLIERDYLPALKLAAEVHIEGPVPGVQNLTAKLGSAISGVKDPKAVNYLLPMSSSSDPNVRRGVTAALGTMHDFRAIRPLAQALYDDDQEVRYYAVVGLGEITGQNQWTPSIANFNQNEKKFLEHWRKWAKQLKPPTTPKAEK